MLSWREVIAVVLITAIVLVLFDHMMRLDQANLCEETDVKCPVGEWVWSKKP